MKTQTESEFGILVAATTFCEYETIEREQITVHL